MKQFLATSLTLVTLFMGPQSYAVITYPGTPPTTTKSSKTENTYTLENNLLKATWSQTKNKLNGPTVTNKASHQTYTSNNGELFSIATKAQAQDPDHVFLGIRKKNEELIIGISNDGTSWETLNTIPLKNFPANLKAVRFGKTSAKGQTQDYIDAGEMGTCELQQITVLNQSDDIADITSKPTKIHKSERKGTSLDIANEQITISANANSTAFAEYQIPNNWKQLSCKIKKGTDTGLSWGPGITLQFDDGKFLKANIRAKGQFTILSPAGEQLINKNISPSLSCDLSSTAFTLTSPVTLSNKNNTQILSATLENNQSGIIVHWSAELRDGSNYISQNYNISSENELTIHGLQFLNGTAAGAKQIGSVPGSPVATDSMFFGVEMPFTANYFEPDTFRSGFPCNLPIKKNVHYDFTSVIGVYPKDQLRRAFNYYLERERSTPSHQFLHYNCWYDLGLNPTRETFLKVIADYHRELTEKRGVAIDSFVMDDGWDDFNAGLWEYNRKKFPNGFDEVSAAARKANSNLGVWISPLGGYGGANQRTAHAKKMGLIQDTLDLSQPRYYQWFHDKCLGLMDDHGVNYFKWDKAGSGVSPHFMALIQCGRELKQHNPNLFINVTVGTWPSPFWLNHIDCTWRTGTGDVSWSGVGDRREQWLTYRDSGCYEKFVKPAPLYPLNSVMHHGLVLGPHFQGAEVAKAGAHFKHAARSYFATGANLQELYLTPDMMTPQAWDQIAEAAKWAKKNEKILIDSHWVGGNPLNLGVYGWASWTPEKSIITLRNSSAKPSQLTIDLTKTLEIPKGMTTTFQTKNAYKDQTHQETKLNGQVTFKLKPFEVLCLELQPIPNPK